MNPRDFNVWTRQILWASALPANCPLQQLDPASDAFVDWLRDFQRQHQLLDDGTLGPTTLFALWAIFEPNTQGIGPLIIGGQPVDLPCPVIRLFPAASHHDVQPDIIGLCAIANFERVARQRLRNQRPPRAHFTIDGARGQGHGVIVQWADPLAQVPFAPSDQPGDLPAHRHGVVVELDNPIRLHYREREGRLRQRERAIARGRLGDRTTRHLAFYPEQINALDLLLNTLTTTLDIPHTFPRTDEGALFTGFDPDLGHHFQGVIARFHIDPHNEEPGAGLVEHLERIFPSTSTQTAVADIGYVFIPNALSRAQPDAPQPVVIPDTERDAVAKRWESEPTSAVQPNAQAPGFSWSQTLGRPGRSRRGRRDRVGALQQRLRAQAKQQHDDES